MGDVWRCLRGHDSQQGWSHLPQSGVVPARDADLLPLAGRSNRVQIGTKRAKQGQTAPSSRPKASPPAASIVDRRQQRARTSQVLKCTNYECARARHPQRPRCFDSFPLPGSCSSLSSLSSHIPVSSTTPSCRLAMVYCARLQIRQACRTAPGQSGVCSLTCESHASPSRAPELFPVQVLRPDRSQARVSLHIQHDVDEDLVRGQNHSPGTVHSFQPPKQLLLPRQTSHGLAHAAMPPCDRAQRRTTPVDRLTSRHSDFLGVHRSLQSRQAL